MKILSSAIIYENPLPQLCSKQSFFPNVAEKKDGTLLAAFAIGQAFESVDSASYLSESADGGLTWSAPRPLMDWKGEEDRLTDYAKITALPDGRIVAMGYAYLRDDPTLPIGNPETGGLLDDFVFCALSEDGGKSFGEATKIPCAWGPHVEASAPITVMQDGSWITPITGFPDWEGKAHGPVCGRALISHDEGKTWNDDSVCMTFGEKQATCYEQRMCQLASGTLVCIGWNEDLTTGERMDNHYTLSLDGGKTWTEPRTTGVRGQASSVCALGGEKLLALHAVRRDTDHPGIYAYVIDLAGGDWKVVDEALVWEPATPIVKDAKMAEIFSFLKFGQPGALLLANGDVMMTHWYADQGQYKTVATRLSLA